MKSLPERTAPREIVGLVFRSLLVAGLLSIVIGVVFPVAFVPAFVVLASIVFLDGFNESSTWKTRLIRIGIAVGLMVIMNMTIWPIFKARLAARWPFIAHVLPRTQMGLDVQISKLINKPATEAEAILRAKIEKEEKEKLTAKVAELAAVGDAEGAADLIRKHKEKLQRIEEKINPPSSLTKKVKGMFSGDNITVSGPNTFSAKAGEEKEFKTLPGYAAEIWASPEGEFVVTTSTNRKYDNKKAFPPIIGKFNVKFLSDTTMEIKPIKL